MTEKLGWEGLNPAREGTDGNHRVLSTADQHREMTADQALLADSARRAEVEALEQEALRLEALKAKAQQAPEHSFNPEGVPQNLERKSH